MNKGHKKRKKKVFHIIGILSITIFCIGSIAYVFWKSYVSALGVDIYQNNKKQINNSNIHAEHIKNRAKEKINKNIIKIFKNSKEYYKKNIDFENDASLQKYLGKNHPLNNPHYVPPDLKKINLKYIKNKAYRPTLRKPARIAFEQMAKAFYKRFNKKLYLLSAYRTSKDQKRLQKYCTTKQCAETEESEHRIGLAIDIHIMTSNNTYIKMQKNTIYYKRLAKNAYIYGFHNSFQKGYNIDGVMEEPRHRRYIGIHIAKELKDHKMTFGEYYYNQKKD